MNLLDQIRTTETFTERLSVRLPCTREAAAAVFAEAACLERWYAGGIARCAERANDRLVLRVGDDHQAEFEFLQTGPDKIALRERVETSPPATVTISFAETGGETLVEIVLTGTMSVFWKLKFLQDWQAVTWLPEKMPMCAAGLSGRAH